MIRDGKDWRGLHATTFAETDWPQKHYFYYWITFVMGDGRVPGPKPTKVAHVLVVTAKGFFNHQVESWLTRLIIISTAKSLMVVFLIFKIKKKTNLNYMHDYRIEDDPYTVRHAVYDATFQCLLWSSVICMKLTLEPWQHQTFAQFFLPQLFDTVSKTKQELI